MLTTLLGYILIGFFLATEGRSRKGQQAQSLDRGRFDRKSTAFVGVAWLLTGLGLLLAPLLNYFRIGSMISGSEAGWVGLIIAAGGISVRWWANRTLGEYYTRTLLVTATQSIVQKGPYRMIRHPGYLGSILMWVGAGLATTNWIVLILAVVVLFTAYYYRIQAEEEMLTVAISQEYSQYKARTWKLIPFVF
jgi:protein-S-isoprenylcysteine O-methyltransferase Ste14